MTDYKKMYYSLFNAITEAQSCLAKGDTAQALFILMKAQLDAENAYIEQSAEVAE